MSFLPNIFNRGSQQPTQQQPAQGAPAQGQPQQQQAPTIGTQPIQNTGAIPDNMVNGQQQSQQNQQQGNPLDQFNGYFGIQAPGTQQNSAQPPQNQQQQNPSQQQPAQPSQQQTGFLPAFDKKRVGEQLSQASFTRSLNPELVTKALSGDANAFMDVLNGVMREGMMASMQFSHGVSEHGLNSAYGRFNTEFDSRVRNYQVQGQAPKHPALQHPAAAASVKAFTQLFAQQDPSLSPEAATEKAEQYLISLSDNLQQHNQSQQQQQQTTQNKSLASSDFSEW